VEDVATTVEDVATMVEDAATTVEAVVTTVEVVAAGVVGVVEVAGMETDSISRAGMKTMATITNENARVTTMTTVAAAVVAGGGDNRCVPNQPTILIYTSTR
jgi:hypothetical protein